MRYRELDRSVGRVENVDPKNRNGIFTMVRDGEFFLHKEWVEGEPLVKFIDAQTKEKTRRKFDKVRTCCAEFRSGRGGVRIDHQNKR